ncbi:MAG: prolipoprotein diacylglyceryl transferase [Deltaproteobacteria bacterium]|jgi:phosphatidylglycerol:prolipoprotein diacylglycerol transferase|nr:prolipoprotein diacylglyceryl transferase [Deltaproteobacteria bacterium]
MWPQLLTIGPFSLNAYGLLVALGALVGLIALQKTAPLAGWPKKEATDLGFWLIVMGLIGARLFYVICHLAEFQRQPLRVLAYWRGGLMFQGGVVLAAFFAYGYVKLKGLNFWGLADSLAPPLALGQSLGRLGCHAAGCCYGQAAPLTFPLTVTFPPGGAAPAGFPLYPTQLSESLGLLALFVFLYGFLKKRPPNGRIFGLYLIGAGSLRLIMERYRGDYRGSPILGEAPTFWLALGAVALGLAIALLGPTLRREKRPAT